MPRSNPAGTRLRDLPNIGAELERQLLEAGVDTPAALRRLGSRQAYLRIRLRDNTACLSKLCALEGAVQGIRWFHLPPQVRRELRQFHANL